MTSAAAFLLAAGEAGDRRRYNIGTGVQTSDRELHTLIARATGAPDEPEFAPARLGDVRDSVDRPVPGRAGSSAGRRRTTWPPGSGDRRLLQEPLTPCVCGQDRCSSTSGSHLWTQSAPTSFWLSSATCRS